jgi:hypothetical protein
VTDIFKKSNSDFNQTKKEFIELTKKHHQDGSIALTAAILTVMVSALFYFYLSKFQIEVKEANYRKNSYLCFNYLNIETENYISDMTKFNWLLRTAFIAMSSGVATAKAKLAFEGLKVTRDARHLQYIKRVASNRYCDKKDLSKISYLNNLPYKTKSALLLDTKIDGTTTFRSQQWEVLEYNYPANIRLQKSFCLKASWKVQGEFSPDLKVSTKEIGMEGISKLKCLPGFQS